MRACAEVAPPVRRWQRVQWQYPAWRGASLSSNRTAPHRQPPPITAVLEVTARLLRLERGLGSAPFLLGERYTIADIALYA